MLVVFDLKDATTEPPLRYLCCLLFTIPLLRPEPRTLPAGVVDCYTLARFTRIAQELT
jgi:hypothetical protein